MTINMLSLGWSFFILFTLSLLSDEPQILDGGGVRGLSSLLILQRIMYVLDGKVDPEVPRPLLPCKYFDMIAGTSTGGWVKSLLVLRPRVA